MTFKKIVPLFAIKKGKAPEAALEEIVPLFATTDARAGDNGERRADSR